MSSSARLKLFWWIVETSASRSRWAARTIAAAGHLVDVADLEAHDPVLHVVHDPNAVAAAELRRAFEQLHEPEALPVDGHGRAALEAHPHQLGLVGRLLGPA